MWINKCCMNFVNVSIWGWQVHPWHRPGTFCVIRYVIRPCYERHNIMWSARRTISFGSKSPQYTWFRHKQPTQWRQGLSWYCISNYLLLNVIIDVTSCRFTRQWRCANDSFEYSTRPGNSVLIIRVVSIGHQNVLCPGILTYIGL